MVGEPGSATAQPSLFLARLAEARPIMLDAAMGTALIEQGLRIPAEDAIAWSLAKAEQVLEVHREHVRAGAELLLANTFGARPPDARELGAAVALAREAGARFLALALWPGLSARQLAQAIGEAARLDFDLIWLETSMQKDHAERALRIAREESGLPVAVSFALASHPSQVRGNGVGELKDLFARVTEKGAAMVGLNCGPWDPEPEPGQTRTLASHGCAALGPDDRPLAHAIDLPALVGELVKDLKVPLAMKPDAGARSPESWAGVLSACVDAGAKLVGGCCGTNQRHLRALRALLIAARSPDKNKTLPA